jgi:hypothetical protein
MSPDQMLLSPEEGWYGDCGWLFTDTDAMDRFRLVQPGVRV